jgi:hypothetical protein
MRSLMAKRSILCGPGHDREDDLPRRPVDGEPVGDTDYLAAMGTTLLDDLERVADA